MPNPEIHEPLTQEQLTKITELQQSGKDVLIKRTSGKMQKGKVFQILSDYRHVRVTFIDEKNPLKQLEKIVDGEEFLAWQKESVEEQGTNDDREEEELLKKLDTVIAQKVSQDAMRALTPEFEENTGEHGEMHNGLPVITRKEFTRLYHTDIRSLGEHGSATFNFQGYVKDTDNGETEYLYVDRMATNGLLKDNEQNGIHIGTDGVRNYSDYSGIPIEYPNEIGEYDIYIEIPIQIQKKHGIVCHLDSIHAAESFDDYSGEANPAEAYYSRMEGKEPELVVIRLLQKPAYDSHAREKVMYIHHQIINYIESGKPFDKLETFVRDLDRRLMRWNKPLPPKGKLLEN